MDQIHTPERLENETQGQYRSRRRIAKLVAGRSKVLARPGEPHKAPKHKVDNRILSKHLGPRQAKKARRIVAAVKRERAAEVARSAAATVAAEAAVLKSEPMYWGPAAHFQATEGLTCTVSAP